MRPGILFMDVPELFLPMIQEVQGRGYTPILSGSIARLAGQVGEPCRQLVDYQLPAADVSARRRLTDVVTGVRGVLADRAVAGEAFGSRLGDFTRHTGKQFLDRLFNLVSLELFIAEVFEEFVRQARPCLIVLGAEKSPAARTIIGLAAKHEIPTLQMAHGVPGRLRAPVAGEYSCELSAQHMALFGESSRDIMLEAGVEPGRLHLVGSPRWDELYAPECKIDKKDARLKLGLRPARNVVLYCTSYALGNTAHFGLRSRQFLAMHRQINEAVKAVDPEIQLIVRPHPWEISRANMTAEQEDEHLAAYRRWLAREGYPDAVISREDKVTAVRAADVVVLSNWSSMVVELALLRRPVICIPFDRMWDAGHPPYLSEGGVLMTGDITSLALIIHDLLFKPGRCQEAVESQSALVAAANYRDDGKASERMVELIVDLASKEARRTVSRKDESFEPEGTELPLRAEAAAGANSVWRGGVGDGPPVTGAVPMRGVTMDHMAGKGYLAHRPGALSRGAVLDVGLKCVHSCEFCYYSDLDSSGDQFKGIRRAKFRTLDECKEILSRLKDGGFVNVDITGGEPSIHPDLIEIVRYAEQDLGLATRMITLGQFLMQKMKRCEHPRLIDDLLEAGLTNLLLSIHAVDAELYSKITGARLDRLLEALRYLDRQGFHYTSNSTVYEGNFRHLPALARELASHNIYMHNFIVMNAYYSWSEGRRSAGVQARYSEIHPYLQEAVNILEASGVAVNIRYAPLCLVRGMERNLVGVVGVRRDPCEWMNQAGHHGGTPEQCAAKIPLSHDGVEPAFEFHPVEGNQIIGRRGAAKLFPAVCRECASLPVCDGVDPGYLKQHGAAELTPDSGPRQTLHLHEARRAARAPHLVKLDRDAPMKDIVAAALERDRQAALARDGGEAPAARASGQEAFSVVEPGAATAGALTSIIVLNLNGADHIRHCLQSIQEWTELPHEVIVVDNGSRDESLTYLRSLPGIQLIENPENLGAPHARNQGLALARGEQIVFLDNDTVVTGGWLDRFVDYARRDPSVGIWGPRSNYVSPPQLVDCATYTDYGGMQDFARQWAAVHDATYSHTKRLILFCMYVNRRVIDRIGGIDPAFGKWGWEDDDFGIRAQIAGFRLGIAHSVYIHHTGSLTSKTAQIDYHQLMRHNWTVFSEKWDLGSWQGNPFEYPIDRLVARPFDAARDVVPIPPG